MSESGVELGSIVKNMIIGHFQDGRRGCGKLAAILNFAQNHFIFQPFQHVLRTENVDLNSGLKVLDT